MNEPRRRLAVNALFSSVDLYLDFAAALIISVVVARQLGPQSYGTYTLLIWIATVGVVVSNNGITTGVMKFIGEARGKRAPDLARGLAVHLERRQMASTIAVCVVFAGLLPFFSELLVSEARARALLWVLVPSIAFRSLYIYYFSAAKGFENFRLAAQVKALVAPINLAIVLALALGDAGLGEFVYAYAFACLLHAGVMRVGLFRGIARERPAPLDKELLGRVRRHMAYASAIVLLDLIILRQTEIFFLELFSTQANIGFYGLGRTLAASAMLLVPGVFTALLLPAMSRTFGQDPELMGGRFLAATRYIVFLVVPVVALCEVFGSEIVRVLYGADYAAAALVFRVAVAAASLGVVSACASSYQLSTDRQPVVLKIMAATAALTIVLDVVLIRFYELAGAIAAGAIGSLVLAIGLLWHAYRTLDVRPQLAAHARVVIAGAIAAVPAVAASMLLPWWLSIPLGGLALVTCYGALTVVFGAWTREELSFLRAGAETLSGALPRAAVGLLRWAERRAGRVSP